MENLTVKSASLPTQWGKFQCYVFTGEDVLGQEVVALTMGSWQNSDSVLLRIHSECLTGDAFFSMRCDCGAQLELAMKRIAEEKCGVIIYLRQEGRGIGLFNKIHAYSLQEGGLDTVDANLQLGFAADMRDYSMCKPVLEYFKLHKLRCITNNPHKIKALEELGFEVVERIKAHTELTPHNEAYFQTKVDKMGHIS